MLFIYIFLSFILFFVSSIKKNKLKPDPKNELSYPVRIGFRSHYPYWMRIWILVELVVIGFGFGLHMNPIQIQPV